MNDCWKVILNPKSGKGRSARQWENLKKIFSDEEIDAEYEFSQSPKHVTELAKKYAEKGYEKIAIVGGDGTLNQAVIGVIQACVTQKITLALIPNGTGNDWARYWKIPTSFLDSVSLLKSGKTVGVDVGKIQYTYQKEPKTTYFINTAGMGFEVSVLQNAEIIRGFFKGASRMYLASVVWSALKGKSLQTKVNINGNIFEGKLYSLAIGNGCFSGGGIKQTPNANPTDGLLDVTLIEKMSVRDTLKALNLLFKGNLTAHPKFHTFRTQEICVENTDWRAIDVDGIVLEMDNFLKISVLKDRVNMIVPE